MYDTFFNEEQKILTNHSQKDGKKDPFLYPAPFKFFLKKYTVNNWAVIFIHILSLKAHFILEFTPI